MCQSQKGLCWLKLWPVRARLVGTSDLVSLCLVEGGRGGDPDASWLMLRKMDATSVGYHLGSQDQFWFVSKSIISVWK